MAMLELDLIKVKGKSEPARIFALVGDESVAAGIDFRKWADKHEKMIENYRSQDFDSVFKCARECVSLSGERLKTFYELYQSRASGLMRKPPGKDWDGVYEALQK